MNQYNQDQPWSTPWYLKQDGTPIPMDHMPQMMWGGWGMPWAGNQGNMAMPYGGAGTQSPPWGMMQNGVWTNQQENSDMMQELALWQERYPEKIKRLQTYVEEVCDREDYDGSMIYDEHPDTVGLQQLCNRILERAMEDSMLQPATEEMEDMVEDNMEGDETLYEAKQYGRPGRPGGPGGPGSGRPPRPPRPPRPTHPPRDNDSWLKDIIPVLLFQELFKRRCRGRNCRRRFY